MENRYIGENIRKTLDIIRYTELEDIPALIISIDYEKCFDRLEHSAILGALKYFNFGDNFCKWIKLLYTENYSCTINNGHISDWFSPSRGLKQGCPISPYLFLLCGETFANNIRNNNKIQGIKVGNKETKISQFADDTNLFIMFDMASLQGIMDHLPIGEVWVWCCPGQSEQLPHGHTKCPDVGFF